MCRRFIANMTLTLPPQTRTDIMPETRRGGYCAYILPTCCLAAPSRTTRVTTPASPRAPPPPASSSSSSVSRYRYIYLYTLYSMYRQSSTEGKSCIQMLYFCENLPLHNPNTHGRIGTIERCTVAAAADSLFKSHLSGTKRLRG